MNSQFEHLLLGNKEWNWSYDKIFTKPNIPPKKLKNALGYASGVNPNDVLILIDDTVFGGAKDGMLVTRDALYCHEIMTPMRKICLGDIKEIGMAGKSQILVNKQNFFKGNIVEHFALLTITARINSVLKEVYGTGEDETQIKKHSRENNINEQPLKHDSLASNNSSLKLKNENYTIHEQPVAVKDFGYPQQDINSLFFIKYEQDILIELKSLGLPEKHFIFSRKILELSKSISLDFNNSKHFDGNLVRVINHDVVILTAFNWCYYAIKNILISNEFNDIQIQNITEPLLIIPVHYIMYKNSASFNTLAAKANPQKVLKETKEYQDFQSIGFGYSKAYELRGLVDGSLKHFPQEIIGSLNDEHTMFFDYLCEEGCNGIAQLEQYCIEYATNSHTRCEALLLELLS
ncbi:hypothetical protein EU510_11380 [Pseudoalteromonas sp. FUC4]|uniref:hypothetical protein n=1 Tax=Pseudoalteromonas sp. FUC4 TaxID=2511201 RepID=UPI0011F331B3|nr:hypothetical protein [Pseudoalteromonas sp. FUC4]KAA1152652.1 hypothetical protein EU510_11380 [Pseudoalteromonas sp. FUC4]